MNFSTTPEQDAFVDTARARSGHGLQIEVEGEVAKSAANNGPGGVGIRE